MNTLLTKNPIALRFLMSETIFSSAVENAPAQDPTIETDTIQSNLSLSDNKDPDFLFWGSNERNILFLIRNPNENYFSAEAEAAFLKTLTALKLSIEDVAVFNRGKTEKSLGEINEVLNPKICVYCEGESGSNRGIFNKFTEVDGISCLYTYSFEEMLTDTNRKRAFWNGIKEIAVV